MNAISSIYKPGNSCIVEVNVVHYEVQFLREQTFYCYTRRISSG